MLATLPYVAATKGVAEGGGMKGWQLWLVACKSAKPQVLSSAFTNTLEEMACNQRTNMCLSLVSLRLTFSVLTPFQLNLTLINIWSTTHAAPTNDETCCVFSVLEQGWSPSGKQVLNQVPNLTHKQSWKASLRHLVAWVNNPITLSWSWIKILLHASN